MEIAHMDSRRHINNLNRYAIDAAHVGDLIQVKQIVDLGADDLESIAMAAIQHGHTTIVRSMFDERSSSVEYRMR